MAAIIYSFPELKTKPTCRIPLYSDEEIEVTLTCVNVFCKDDIKYNIDTISFLDPEVTVDCLKMALVSNIFSERFKSYVKTVLKNVEFT